VALRLEHFAQSREDRQPEFGKFGPAVIDHRLIHCPQNSVGDVRWTWNLKKMTACMNHFILEKVQSL
jgi:hypothetical protein